MAGRPASGPENPLIALLQRVSEADVSVSGESVGGIGRGLLAFLAVEPQDDPLVARRLIDRIVAYRVFPDGADRMNLGLVDVGGQLLLVPQFTLAADTRKGLRPSFAGAAGPELGERLFDIARAHACARLPGRVAAGRFGADMKVRLVNDGPVTFWMQIPVPGETERA
jgi:D-aminoacyl-tRNA deacylase